MPTNDESLQLSGFSSAELGAELIRRAEQQIPRRSLGVMAAAIGCVGLSLVGLRPSTVEANMAFDPAITELDVVDESLVTEIEPAVRAPKARSAPRVALAQEDSKSAPPGPKPSEKPNERRRQRLAERRVNNMKLTVPGYLKFIEEIDTSYLEFAQQFRDFNPQRVDIKQKDTEFVTLHYTVTVPPPGEPFKPKRLIRSMAERWGVCCGVNAIIDRNEEATVYQVAPIDAKLRHNPPFDSVNTGIELVAKRQDTIKTRQYNKAAYWAIHTVVKEKLLGARPLRSLIRGHGEVRERYRDRHPHTAWDVRTDFDKRISFLFRRKIKAFLRANPEVSEITSAVDILAAAGKSDKR